jgi:hypothetical protein
VAPSCTTPVQEGAALWKGLVPGSEEVPTDILAQPATPVEGEAGGHSCPTPILHGVPSTQGKWEGGGGKR